MKLISGMSSRNGLHYTEYAVVQAYKQFLKPSQMIPARQPSLQADRHSCSRKESTISGRWPLSPSYSPSTSISASSLCQPSGCDKVRRKEVECSFLQASTSLFA